MRDSLTDGRITIRKFRQRDVFPLYEAIHSSVTELYPYLPWCHPDYSLVDSEEWIRSREQYWHIGASYDFAVVSNDNDKEILGGVGLNLIEPDQRKANIGYWVRTDSASKGIATESVRLLIKFAIEDLGYQRVEIVISTDNAPSLRVAEKLDAVKEGLLRHRLYLHGECKDAYIYSVIAEDYFRDNGELPTKS
ncbi:MAG: ribosomal-protein-serine acetyltransferase [Legionellales bacterium]|mgnify:CR=1 FL=1|nr:ribosomal-protein-serine acetyltransferase [Legionellales bacterium]|tara:strand:- start:330 stop:908 length:579 start_codon:yes stop_codon:yes gene_type:complete